jgi:hypothetical protein
MNNPETQPIKFELRPNHRGVSDEELIEDVRRIARELGTEYVTSLQYRQFGNFSDSTIFNRLGPWNQVLLKAGLKQTVLMNIPDDDLFQNLERLWIALGRQPSRREMIRPLSIYSSRPYTRRFGTWWKALEAFVEYVNSSSDTEVVSEVAGDQAASKRTKRDPSLRLRFLVMRRDNFKCAHCGRSPATLPGLELEVDHVVPWTKGGETELTNLQTLCIDCNRGKGNLLDCDA